MNERQCNVIDLYNAGEQLSRRLNNAQGEQRSKFSVHIYPVANSADWADPGPQHLQELVTSDVSKVHNDWTAIGRSGDAYYTFLRHYRRAQNSTAEFKVKLDTSGLMPVPDESVYHAYFAPVAALAGASAQTGPFLLYTAIQKIWRWHEQRIQFSSNGESAESSADAVLQLFGIFLLSQMCLENGTASNMMHLTHAAWRLFIQNPDHGDCRALQQYLVEDQLRNSGLVHETTTWIVDNFCPSASARPASVPQYVTDIDDALRWVNSFFTIDPKTGLGVAPAIQLRSLGKAASPYEPADRRLARGF